MVVKLCTSPELLNYSLTDLKTLPGMGLSDTYLYSPHFFKIRYLLSWWIWFLLHFNINHALTICPLMFTVAKKLLSRNLLYTSHSKWNWTPSFRSIKLWQEIRIQWLEMEIENQFQIVQSIKIMPPTLSVLFINADTPFLTHCKAVTSSSQHWLTCKSTDMFTQVFAFCFSWAFMQYTLSLN